MLKGDVVDIHDVDLWTDLWLYTSVGRNFTCSFLFNWYLTHTRATGLTSDVTDSGAIATLALFFNNGTTLAPFFNNGDTTNLTGTCATGLATDITDLFTVATLSDFFHEGQVDFESLPMLDATPAGKLHSQRFQHILVFAG